jgi:hypothetical protein
MRQLFPKAYNFSACAPALERFTQKLVTPSSNIKLQNSSKF